MHIGIITLSRTRVSQGVFYNLQDIGLANALVAAGHKVILYRFTQDSNQMILENGVQIVFRKSFGIGKQTLAGFSFLDKSIDRLICFSDNQVLFPVLCRWCRTRGILLQPYVGVIYSNSPNQIVKKITDILVRRNIRQYRNMKVYVKTPDVEKVLNELSVKDTEVVPVCLNRSLLHETVQKDQINQIRKRYGYQPEDKILLFVGRMESEKEPHEMLQLFDDLYRQHPEYRLRMVGKGVLYEEMKADIISKGLEGVVRLEEQVANRDMWQLYCSSSCFINLNRHEIYGMAILEAMYYRCPVIAIHAPGPDFIIGEGNMGYLCDDLEELMMQVEKVVRGETETGDTKKYIETCFTWDKVTERFL